MAFLAESHQIRPVVRAAVRQLDLVMNHVGGAESSLVFASFAQWVRRKKDRPQSFPRAGIPFGCGWVTAVLVVLLGCLLCVFIAVAACRQLGTAGVSTRFLGFVRHGSHLLRGKTKAPWDCSREARFYFTFSMIHYITFALGQTETFTDIFLVTARFSLPLCILQPSIDWTLLPKQAERTFIQTIPIISAGR